MTISFSGLASGLDTSSWVESLVRLKQAKVTTLEEKKENIKLSQTTLSTIKSIFSSFRASVERVTDAKFGISTMDLFVQNVATSSNTNKLTATVTSDAEVNNYNILIEKLATNTQAKSNYQTTVTVRETATESSRADSMGLSKGTVFVTTTDGVKHGITLQKNDTMSSIINKFKAVGVDASYNEETGKFNVNLSIGDIDDNGTGIINAFNLVGVNEGYETGKLEYVETQKHEVNAILSTKISELGEGIEFNGTSKSVKVQNSSNEVQTIWINKNTTLGDFINQLKDAGLYARLTDDSTLEITGGRIVSGGTFDTSIFGFTEEPQSAMVTGSILTETILVPDIVDLQTRLVEDLGVTRGFYEVTNPDGDKFYLSVYSGQTMADLISDLGHVGINADLDSANGILTLTGGTYKTLTDAEVNALCNNGTIVGVTSENRKGTNLLTSLGLDLQANMQVSSTRSMSRALSYSHVQLAMNDGIVSDYINFTTDKEKIVVHEETGAAIGTVTVTRSETTFSELFAELSKYGIDGDIHDGVVMFSSDDKYYLTGKVIDNMNMSTDYTTITVTTTCGVTQSSGTITYSTTQLATETSRISDFVTTLSACNTFAIKDKDGNLITSITVGATDTFADLFQKLVVYGVDGDINDGQISFLHNDGGYVEGAFVNALGIVTTLTTVTSTHTFGTTSTGSVKSYTTTHVADASEALSTYGLSGDVTVYDHDGNTLGTVSGNGKTFAELFRDLEQYGVACSIDDGRVTFTQTDGGWVSGSLVTALGIQTTTEVVVTTHTVGTTTTGSQKSFTTTHVADASESLATYGLSGDVNVYDYDGNSLGTVTGTGKTFAELFRDLEQYGVACSLDDGRVTFTQTDGGWVDGSLVTALGISTTTETVTTTHTVGTTTTGSQKSFTTTHVADASEALSTYGLSGDVNVYDYDGNSLGTVTGTGKTFAELFRDLEQYGVACSLDDGRVTFTQTDGGWVDGSLVTALGISTTTETVTTTHTVGSSTSGGVQTYVSVKVATADESIATYGLSGDVTVYDGDGNSLGTVTGTGKTFAELFRDLEQYGVACSLDDGRVTFNQTDGGWVDGSLVTALGISTTTETITTTHTVGASSSGSALSYTVNYSADGDTTFSQLGIGNKNYTIINGRDGSTVSTGSITGDTKLGEFFQTIGQMGLHASIDGGYISISSDAGYYLSGDLATALGIGTYTYYNTVHGSTTTVMTAAGVVTISASDTITVDITTTSVVNTHGTVTIDAVDTIVVDIVQTLDVETTGETVITVYTTITVDLAQTVATTNEVSGYVTHISDAAKMVYSETVTMSTVLVTDQTYKALAFDTNADDSSTAAYDNRNQRLATLMKQYRTATVTTTAMTTYTSEAPVAAAAAMSSKRLTKVVTNNETVEGTTTICTVTSDMTLEQVYSLIGSFTEDYDQLNSYSSWVTVSGDWVFDINGWIYETGSHCSEIDFYLTIASGTTLANLHHELANELDIAMQKRAGVTDEALADCDVLFKVTDNGYLVPDPLRSTQYNSIRFDGFTYASGGITWLNNTNFNEITYASVSAGSTIDTTTTVAATQDTTLGELGFSGTGSIETYSGTPNNDRPWNDYEYYTLQVDETTTLGEIDTFLSSGIGYNILNSDGESFDNSMNTATSATKGTANSGIYDMSASLASVLDMSGYGHTFHALTYTVSTTTTTTVKTTKELVDNQNYEITIYKNGKLERMSLFYEADSDNDGSFILNYGSSAFPSTRTVSQFISNFNYFMGYTALKFDENHVLRHYASEDGNSFIVNMPGDLAEAFGWNEWEYKEVTKTLTTTQTVELTTTLTDTIVAGYYDIQDVDGMIGANLGEASIDYCQVAQDAYDAGQISEDDYNIIVYEIDNYGREYGETYTNEYGYDSVYAQRVLRLSQTDSDTNIPTKNLVRMAYTTVVTTYTTVTVQQTQTIASTVTITVDSAGTTTVNVSRTYTIHATETTEVDTTGTVTVSVSQTITINATSTETVDVTGTVTVDLISTQTVTVNKTSSRQSYDVTHQMDGNTKLGQVASDSGSVTGVYNGEAFTINLNGNTTVDGFIGELAAYGIHASILNGAMSFNGTSAGYITAATGSAATLGAAQAYSTSTSSVVHGYNSNNSRFTRNITHTANGNTTLGLLSLGDGSVSGFYHGQAFTVNINADTTIDGFIAQLAAYGVNASINNGTMTFRGTDSGYITAATGSAASLGAAQAYSTSTTSVTHGYNSGNSHFERTITNIANGNTTLGQISLGDGSVSGFYHGQAFTVNINADTTIDGFIAQLAAYGVNASINNGTMTFSGTNAGYITAATGSAASLGAAQAYSTSTTSVTHGYNSGNSHFERTITNIANGNTTLGQISLGDGSVSGFYHGQAFTVNINADTTIDGFIAQLAAYGINASIKDGTMTFRGTDSGFITAATGSAASLGAAQAYSTFTTSITVGYNSGNEHFERTVTNTMMGNTTVGQIADTVSGSKVTNGTVNVNYHGQDYTVTINSETTIDGFIAQLAAYGIHASVNDGKMTFEGTDVAYITGASGAAANLGAKEAHDETVSTVVNGTNTSGTDQKRTIINTMTAETTLKDLGYNSGNITVMYAGTTYTVKMGTSNSINDMITALAGYGISSMVDENGVLTITGTTEGWVTGATSSLDKLVKKAYTTSVSTTIYGENGVSDQLDKVTTNAVNNKSVKLVDLQDSNGNDLNISTGSYYIYEDGVRTTHEITEETTVNDLMAELAGYGLIADIDENGAIAVSGHRNSYLATSALASGNSNIVDILFSEWDFNRIYNSNNLEVPQAIVEAVTRNTTFSNIAEATKTTEGAFKEGLITILKNGVQTHLYVNANDTIGTFLDELAMYGFDSVINDKGQIIIKTTGDSKLLAYNGSQASNVLDIIGGNADKWVITKSYMSDVQNVTTYEDLFINVTEDTKLSSIKQITTTDAANNTVVSNSTTNTNWEAFLGSLTGKLEVIVDGEKNYIEITKDETIGSLLSKFRSMGLEANVAGGKITIHSGYKDMSISNLSGSGYSNIVNNNLLKFNADIGGFVSSSDSIISTTTHDKTLSSSDWVQSSTKLSALDIRTGSFSVYKNGQRARVNITADDTFATLQNKINTTLGDVKIEFKDGYMIMSSATGIVTAGSSTDSSNFATVTGIYAESDGTVSSNRELYKADHFAKVTDAGIFRNGNVTTGTFTVGTHEITITNSTTIDDIIAEINAYSITSDPNNETGATAFWDNAEGNLVIKSRTSGNMYVNIEAGTSNFTDILGFTKAVNVNGNNYSALNTDIQTLGGNARIKIDNVTYTSNSNTIGSDVTRIEGVTLNLKDVSEGEVIELKIEKDKKIVADALEDIVTSYNELMSAVDEAIASGGELADQTTLKIIRNQLRSYMTGTDIGSIVYRNLDAIGISVNRAVGSNVSTQTADIIHLNFNRDAFYEKFTDNPYAVKSLLIGSDTNTGVLTKVEDLIESSLTGISGYFDSQNSAYNNQISTLNRQINKANQEVARYREMLENKFASMDMLIAQMQEQYSSFLKS